MPLFVWKEEYSVGVDELDNHHKELFKIFNSLYDKCMNPDDMESIQPNIEKLIEYSQYHFYAEEQYMQDMGYKGIVIHIKQHREFFLWIEKLRNSDEDGDSDTTKELMIFLGKWLLKHVLEEDNKYA